jgi:hypothetical protein
LRVQEQKKIAIAEVCNALRGERERIARGVSASALDLIRAVNEESAFFEGLKAQDETLPGLLRPAAFPVALGPDSAVCSWLAAALGVSEALCSAHSDHQGAQCASRAAKRKLFGARRDPRLL